MGKTNKKLIYLSVFLILSVFLVSACNEAKGTRIGPGRFTIKSVEYLNVYNCTYAGDNYDPFKAGYTQHIESSNSTITIINNDRCREDGMDLVEFSCNGTIKLGITEGTCSLGCGNNACSTKYALQ